MNYIRHLTGFFDRAAKDYRLNATHISLYMAIFQLWNINRFKNPISISRSEIMELSKVSSKNTYHKCMKELHKYGYLRYDPSYHPLRGSWVYLFVFGTPVDASLYKSGTGDEQALDSQGAGIVQAKNRLAAESHTSSGFQSPLNISKHIKHNKQSLSKKNEMEKEREKEKNGDEVENNILNKVEQSGEAAITGADKSPPAEIAADVQKPEKIPAGADLVIQFFLKLDYPECQALKFFHYYNATGWKVGGKSPIENWHSAAHSWMLNPHNTGSQTTKKQNHAPERNAKQLSASTDKDYAEPL